jgi:hypothetical protein
MAARTRDDDRDGCRYNLRAVPRDLRFLPASTEGRDDDVPMMPAAAAGGRRRRPCGVTRALHGAAAAYRATTQRPSRSIGRLDVATIHHPPRLRPWRTGRGGQTSAARGALRRVRTRSRRMEEARRGSAGVRALLREFCEPWRGAWRSAELKRRDFTTERATRSVRRPPWSSARAQRPSAPHRSRDVAEAKPPADEWQGDACP